MSSSGEKCYDVHHRQPTSMRRNARRVGAPARHSSRDVTRVTPLSVRAPLVTFGIAAIVLSVVVLAVVPDPGPFDSADEGSQRSGLLVPAAQSERLPSLGVPVTRRALLLVFDRDVPSAPRFRRFRSALPPGAAVVLVVPAGSSHADLAGTPVVAASCRLKEAVAMPTPRDGGSPIGYAVVDEARLIRYATLDPQYFDHVDEAATMLAGVS